MAQFQLNLTVTTPADVTVAEVVGRLSRAWNYPATVDGQPNPQTRAEFVRERLGGILGDAIVNAWLAEELEAARQQIVTSARRITVT